MEVPELAEEVCNDSVDGLGNTSNGAVIGSPTSECWSTRGKELGKWREYVQDKFQSEKEV